MSEHTTKPHGASMRRQRISSWIGGLLASIVLWGILTGWDPESWVVGLPITIGSAMLLDRFAHREAGGFDLVPAVRFAGYFAGSSIASGWDVARRVLSPRLNLEPGFLHYPVNLNSHRARTLFASTVNLIPGTLSVSYDGDVLLVHVFDSTQPNDGGLKKLESLIADVLRDSENRVGVNR